jgi:hypothetical protein
MTLMSRINGVVGVFLFGNDTPVSRCHDIVRSSIQST